jgi:hypothetical protein
MLALLESFRPAPPGNTHVVESRRRISLRSTSTETKKTEYNGINDRPPAIGNHFSLITHLG